MFGAGCDNTLRPAPAPGRATPLGGGQAGNAPFHGPTRPHQRALAETLMETGRAVVIVLVARAIAELLVRLGRMPRGAVGLIFLGLGSQAGMVSPPWRRACC